MPHLPSALWGFLRICFYRGFWADALRTNTREAAAPCLPTWLHSSRLSIEAVTPSARTIREAFTERHMFDFQGGSPESP